MEKQAFTKAAMLLKQAATELRQVTAERDTYKEQLDEALSKAASVETRQRCEKLASSMQSKGLTGGEPLAHIIEGLEKKAESGKLGEVEQAVDLVGPDMWGKLATAASDEGQGVGATAFESVIMSLGQRPEERTKENDSCPRLRK